jgi:hypothetical protein
VKNIEESRSSKNWFEKLGFLNTNAIDYIFLATWCLGGKNLSVVNLLIMPDSFQGELDEIPQAVVLCKFFSKRRD